MAIKSSRNSIAFDSNPFITDGSVPTRKIYIIETPPTSKEFKQCAWIGSEEELREAKLERPDLIFRDPTPDEHAVLQGDAEVADVMDGDIPEVDLTPQQKHIMEILDKPMSLHGLGKKKPEIKESDS